MRRLVLVASAVLCVAWVRSPGRREGYDVPNSHVFAAWLAEDPARRTDYDAFVAALADAGVADVVPPWHLWRQGTDWRSVEEPPFAEPSRDAWASVVPTLELLRDEVVPLVGPVEVVSGFRTDSFNAKAGGAKGSRHKYFEAVDVVPKRRWERTELHGVLQAWWTDRGPALNVGLGLYDKIRFHVDAWKYRTWTS